MDRQKFTEKLDILFDSIRQKFQVKGDEYAAWDNVFANFDRGAQIKNEQPELVLDGYLTKHYVSYRDMLDQIEEGHYPSIQLIEEKLGDIVLYFILQKIMMENRTTPF